MQLTKIISSHRAIAVQPLGQTWQGWRLFALLLAANLVLVLASWTSLPWYPVPLTLQTLAVCSLGVFVRREVAVASVALWLVEGIVGLPVFAPGAGLLVLNLGYLLGMVPMVYVMATCITHNWGRSLIKVTLAQLLAYAAVYICGVGVLAHYVGLHTAIITGFIPFIFGAILKISILSLASVLYYHR